MRRRRPGRRDEWRTAAHSAPPRGPPRRAGWRSRASCWSVMAMLNFTTIMLFPDTGGVNCTTTKKAARRLSALGVCGGAFSTVPPPGAFFRPCEAAATYVHRIPAVQGPSHQGHPTGLCMARQRARAHRVHPQDHREHVAGGSHGASRMVHRDQARLPATLPRRAQGRLISDYLPHQPPPRRRRRPSAAWRGLSAAPHRQVYLCGA